MFTRSVPNQLSPANPLFTFWRLTFGHQANYNSMDRLLSGGVVSTEALAARYYARAAATKVAWAVPGPEALEAIATDELVQARGIVEVGAGRGYWASMLSRLGVNVIACDLEPPDSGMNYFWPDEFDALDRKLIYPVVRDDASRFASVHAHRVLLMVWPNYDQSWAADAVEAFWLSGGQKIFYVGEGIGGCTGDDRLHWLLGYGWHGFGETPVSVPASRFREVACWSIPQWDGIRDSLAMFERVDHPELGIPKL